MWWLERLVLAVYATGLLFYQENHMNHLYVSFFFSLMHKHTRTVTQITPSPLTRFPFSWPERHNLLILFVCDADMELIRIFNLEWMEIWEHIGMTSVRHYMNSASLSITRKQNTILGLFTILLLFLYIMSPCFSTHVSYCTCTCWTGQILESASVLIMSYKPVCYCSSHLSV